MNVDAKCPYCGHVNDIDLTDIPIEDGYTFQNECCNCNKVFNSTILIIVNTIETKCDCQGVNHEWELTPCFPQCCSKWRCKYCGEEKELTDSDRKKYKIPTLQEYLKSLPKWEQQI